jgi:hypothetical protein
MLRNLRRERIKLIFILAVLLSLAFCLFFRLQPSLLNLEHGHICLFSVLNFLLSCLFTTFVRDHTASLQLLLPFMIFLAAIFMLFIDVELPLFS